MFAFSVLEQKSFLDKSGQKNQNCQFRVKFGTKYNLMKFNFSVFDYK